MILGELESEWNHVSTIKLSEHANNPAVIIETNMHFVINWKTIERFYFFYKILSILFKLITTAIRIASTDFVHF